MSKNLFNEGYWPAFDKVRQGIVPMEVKPEDGAEIYRGYMEGIKDGRIQRQIDNARFPRCCSKQKP